MTDISVDYSLLSARNSGHPL